MSPTYFHCASHELNLALSKSSIVPDIHNMVCLLQTLTKFFVDSPKLEQELYRCIKSNIKEKHLTQWKKIKSLYETRWVERHTAFEDLHLLYKHVLDCLSNMKNNNRMWDPKTLIEASGILDDRCEVFRFFSYVQIPFRFYKTTLSSATRVWHGYCKWLRECHYLDEWVDGNAIQRREQVWENF